MQVQQPAERLLGLLCVLALHAGALWGLWSNQLIPSPIDAATLFVNFISPPLPPKVEQIKPLQAPQKLHPIPIPQPQPRQLVADAVAVVPADHVEPPPPSVLAPDVSKALPLPGPVAVPMPSGPVTMTAELSVGCPERTVPTYPVQSRRKGETGVVVLRVELDTQGRVTQAQVNTSSGYARLDDASLEAVRTWRCTPPTRNGLPVRAVALQPFNFVL